MLLAALAAASETIKSSGADLTSVLTNSLFQYGLLGLFVLCMIFRKFVVPEWVLKSAEERHAAELTARDERIAHLETQVQRLQDLATGELMPALTKAAEINARFVEEMAHRRYAADRGERG